MRLADRKFGLALLLSASVHLFVIWYYLRARPAPVETPQEVTFVYRQQELSGQPPGKAGQVRGVKSKKKGKSLSLSAFTPKLSLQYRESPPESTEPEEYSWTDSRAYDGVESVGFQSGVVGHETFIAALWRMIDQYIEENQFFSEYNHTGKVFLRFEVDENGNLEKRSFTASAPDRVLKVIAARAIRKAIKNETGDIRFPGKRMVLHARFTWGSYEACSSLRGFRGGLLSFCHYAENKRKKFTAGEKVATYAGHIYNHGPWAYEEIQKYRREERRRRSAFDPFEEYKRDPDWNL